MNKTMTQLPPPEFFDSHSDFCKACANSNRLKILDLLREGERTVSSLTEASDIPQPTVSQHLSVLRERAVVTRRKEGVKSYYSVTDERIYNAIDIMRTITREELGENGQ